MNKDNQELVQKALKLSDFILNINPIDITSFTPSINDILKPYRDIAKRNTEWIAKISDPYVQMKQIAELISRTIGTPQQTVQKLVEGLRVSFDSEQLSAQNVTINKKTREILLLLRDESIPNDSHIKTTRTTEVSIEVDKRVDLSNPPITLRGLVSRVIFIKQTSHLVFNGIPPIKIMENTPMFSLCRLLFGRVGDIGKKWSTTEIKERIGDNDPLSSHVPKSIKIADRIKGGSGKKRERQIPDAIRHLNKRIGKKDFILCNNNWVTLNPQYYEYYK